MTSPALHRQVFTTVKTCPELVKSDVAGSATNTHRPLTHSLDVTKEGLAVDATRVCSVDGCSNPLRARGWCATHWARWRKHGTVELRTPTEQCSVDGCTSPPRSTYADYCETHYYRIRRTGSVNDPCRIEGICGVDGCSAAASRSGHRLGVDGVYCRMHYLRLKKRGDVHFEPRGSSSPKWTGENATNSGVHQRIRAQRGHARNYACIDCGGQSAHWSYDHESDDERYDDVKGPYTTDLSHYHPRCVPCHKSFDLDKIKERRG